MGWQTNGALGLGATAISSITGASNTQGSGHAGTEFPADLLHMQGGHKQQIMVVRGRGTHTEYAHEHKHKQYVCRHARTQTPRVRR